MIGTMTYFSTQLDRHLHEKGLSAYRLAKLCGIHEQHMYKIARGERRPTDDMLEKFAEADIGLTLNQLRGWRAADEYRPEELIEALKIELSPEALLQLLQSTQPPTG